MVTADTPQTFRYIATNLPAKRAAAPPRQHVSDATPDSITYALRNQTQPSPPPANLTPKIYLKPMTQIHLASNYTDVEIGGPDGNYLYAASHWGLEIFTLIEPTKPARVGEIATPGRAQAIAIEGETAYIADGAAGVHVIDIAVPTDPNIVKTLGSFTDARRVRVADGNLYVLDKARGDACFQPSRCS